MKPKDFYDILNVGGSILGNSRCPFKRMRIIENGFDKVKAMKNTYKKLELDCLVVLGGNGSIKSANMLSQEGLNVIALPKTIDNDLVCYRPHTRIWFCCQVYRSYYEGNHQRWSCI